MRCCRLSLLGNVYGQAPLKKLLRLLRSIFADGYVSRNLNILDLVIIFGGFGILNFFVVSEGYQGG